MVFVDKINLVVSGSIRFETKDFTISLMKKMYSKMSLKLKIAPAHK